MHKTGTTSLQYFMKSHEQWLSEKGILYPRSGRGPGSFPQHVAGSLALMTEEERLGTTHGDKAFDGLDYAKIVADLKDEIAVSTCPCAVLSSEIFSVMRHDSIERFGAAFSEFDVVPVLFVRNFPDYIDAIYQLLSITYRTSWSIEKCLSVYEGAFSLASRAEAWAAVAFDKRIRVINFDGIRERGVVDTFMREIGAPIGELLLNGKEERLLVSAPAYLVAIARALRQQGRKEEEIDKVLQGFSRLAVAEPQTNLPADIRHELKQKYLEQLALLRASRSVVGLEVNDRSEAVLAAIDNKVLVDDLAGAVMAISRALAAQNVKATARSSPETRAETLGSALRGRLSAVASRLRSLRQVLSATGQR
jgi:hypothetical protein